MLFTYSLYMTMIRNEIRYEQISVTLYNIGIYEQSLGIMNFLEDFDAMIDR